MSDNIKLKGCPFCDKPVTLYGDSSVRHINWRCPAQGITNINDWNRRTEISTKEWFIKTYGSEPIVKNWVGCRECDCSFACYDGKTKCKRLEQKEEESNLNIFLNSSDEKKIALTFLRMLADKVEQRKQWDIPTTMAAAIRNAANILERVAS